MKIRWTLFGMNPLKAGHLEANVNFWKMDTLFESARLLKKMDKSIMVKVVGKSKQAKLIFDMVRNQNEFTKENIDEIINYEINEVDRDGDYVVTIELFINEVYFDTQQAMAVPTADIRRKLNKIKALFRTTSGERYEPTTRQGFIDIFESELRKYYTKTYSGDVLEDDGVSLSVTKL